MVAPAFGMHLPGQGSVLHSIVSSVSPSHSFPPWAGTGLVHDLVRLLEPPPHKAEHLLYSDHSVNPPFTKWVFERLFFRKENTWEKTEDDMPPGHRTHCTKKWSFPLRVSWAHLLKKILNRKLHFFVQWRKLNERKMFRRRRTSYYVSRVGDLTFCAIFKFVMLWFIRLVITGTLKIIHENSKNCLTLFLTAQN